jgi:flagellar hook-associated protein 2
MSGTINSLGLGSGVLTSDLLDKLKSADTAALITPIDAKLTLQKQKDGALSLLGSLLTTFKSSVSSLSDTGLYQKRNVSGNTDSVSVTANAGVAVQSFSITDTQLALKNVKESGKFTATSSSVATGAGTVTLAAGGASYAIDYTSSTSLETFKDSINSIAGGSVKASTLQVGTGDFRLILTSVNTGETQTISLTDSAGGTLDTKLLAYDSVANPTGMQEIQAARDASFKFNGITLTRSSNSITDITLGMTINLLKDGGSTNIAISQDTQSISDALSSFTTNYNSLTSQLTSMTTTNVTEGKVGIFNGDSTINSITREVNKLITSVSTSGLSLPQFGINLSEAGIMSFKSADFLTKFKADATKAETFFAESSTVVNNNIVKTNGVFTDIKDLLTRYTDPKGTINTLTTGSATETKTLLATKTRSQALLDARYDTMQARFAAYDSMISKLNNQFNALKQQIDAQTLAASGG